MIIHFLLKEILIRKVEIQSVSQWDFLPRRADWVGGGSPTAEGPHLVLLCFSYALSFTLDAQSDLKYEELICRLVDINIGSDAFNPGFGCRNRNLCCSGRTLLQASVNRGATCLSRFTVNLQNKKGTCPKCRSEMTLNKWLKVYGVT